MVASGGLLNSTPQTSAARLHGSEAALYGHCGARQGLTATLAELKAWARGAARVLITCTAWQ